MKQKYNNQNSLKRWLKNALYPSFIYHRWLNQSAKQALTEKVAEAEVGHYGEIYLIIENRLPLNFAYRFDCRQRALQLFAEHCVWDTEQNSGVLIYLNLCEHQLQIVADRGVCHFIESKVWQKLCDEAIVNIKHGEYQEALMCLIEKTGVFLRTYFACTKNPRNELSNQIVHL